MFHSRALHPLAACLALLASSCSRGIPQAPLIAPFAEDMATESQFTFDGVDVTGRRAVAPAGSIQAILASTRLLHPQRYPQGVKCRLQICGVKDGHVILRTHTAGTLEPDRAGRVSIQGDLRIPNRPDEYEIQIEITDSEAIFVVGRVPLIVVPDQNRGVIKVPAKDF